MSGVLAVGPDRAAAPVGGGLVRDSPATPLRESLARLERLVSPWSGVVREVYEVLAARDDARLPRFAAVLGDVRPLLGFHPDHLDESSGGCAEDRGRARAAAIGEAVERYAASFSPTGQLLARAAELGEAAVAPGRFALFAPEQHAEEGFPFVPLTAETLVRWTSGFTLPDGAACLLPGQLVYLEWHGLRPDEEPVGYATSSGLACAPTLVEAVLAGLLELVERDAFMLTWTHRLSLPLLDWSAEPELRAWEERYLAPAGGEHEVVDLSCFVGVPVALAVVRGDGVAEPACAVGAGSAATAAEAWRKALAEAYSVRSWGRGLLRGGDGGRAGVSTFADHVRFHAGAEHRQASAFLTAAAERRPLGDVPSLRGETPGARVRELCGLLAAQGCRAAAVDVTTPDVRDAGLAVARAVVPELCQLDVRHDARFLGGTRLRTRPLELGLVAESPSWETFNPDPHPFP
jgi:ribosomal protein S12 methylthiotransferase accessory factor